MVASEKVPEEGAGSFACPLCGVVAQQDWEELYGTIHFKPSPLLCQCEECEQVSLWFNGSMLVPATGGVRAPSEDLPKEVQDTYNEARSVVAYSPRAAASLLRLAIEQLCVRLNGEGPMLDEHIAMLRDRGLAGETVKMLHVVRLVGNNAIHPVDRIGLSERPEIVQALFWLVNEIADEIITKPKQRAEATSWIPQDEWDRITKRHVEKAARLAKKQDG